MKIKGYMVAAVALILALFIGSQIYFENANSIDSNKLVQIRDISVILSTDKHEYGVNSTVEVRIFFYNHVGRDVKVPYLNILTLYVGFVKIEGGIPLGVIINTTPTEEYSSIPAMSKIQFASATFIPIQIGRYKISCLNSSIEVIVK